MDDKIKLVNPKGNQPCVFIGRIVAEAKAPILWSLDVRSEMENTLMLGKIEGKSIKPFFYILLLFIMILFL